LRKDDEPPNNWFEPMIDYKGEEHYIMDYYKTKRLSREDVDQWITDYYLERGWDPETGIPTKEKLAELGLEDLAPRSRKKK